MDNTFSFDDLFYFYFQPFTIILMPPASISQDWMVVDDGLETIMLAVYSYYTYRALDLLDAKVVLLLLPLSVGDDVQGGEDYRDDQEDGHTADYEDCHPTH